MTNHAVATLEYTNEKSCSVDLDISSFKPNGNTDNVTGSEVLKISSSDGNVGYFNLFPTQKSQNQKSILFMNGLYASKLGFHSTAQVSVQLLQNVPACVTAWLEPLSVDDWEILELHAEQVESSLLDQIRVLWSGQVFPLWVDRNVCIFLKTVAIEPESHCAILMPLTELIVEPKVSREVVEKDLRSRVKADAKEIQNIDQDELNTPETTPKEIATTVADTGDEHSLFRRLLRLTLLRRLFRFVLYILRIMRNRIYSSLTSLLSIFYPSLAIEDVSNVPQDVKEHFSCLNDFPGNLDLILRVEPMADIVSLPMWHQAGCIRLNADSDKSLGVQNKPNPKLHKGCDETGVTAKADDTGIFIVNLQKLPSPREQEIKISSQKMSAKHATPSKATPKCAVVRMCVQALSQFAMILRQNRDDNEQLLDIPSRSLEMSPDLRRQLRIGAYSKVRITKLKTMPRTISYNVKKITFTMLQALPKNFSLQELQDSFERWLAAVADERHPIPVTVGTLICVPILPLFSDVECSRDSIVPQVEFVIEKFHFAPNIISTPDEYFLLSCDVLKQVEVEFAAPSEVTVVPSLGEIDPEIPQDSVEGLVPSHQKMISECMVHAEAVMQSRPIPKTLTGKLKSIGSGCLLVTGPVGVGKTTLCRAMLRRLSMLPGHLAYVQVISCSSLKGKKPDTIKKLLQGAIAEAEWRQPSAIFLDDIDHLVPSCCSPDGERSPGAMYALQIAAIFKDALSAVCCKKSEQPVGLTQTPKHVLVVATAASQQAIHPLLLPSLGCHLFDKTVVMELPNDVERVEILRSMLTRHTDVHARQICRLNLDAVSQMTEGYSVYDFLQITKRAILSFKSGNRSKKASSSIIIDSKSYQDAITDYVPVSLQDAHLHKPKKSCWSDVGGLDLVRKNLMEKLVWPVKYARLYQTAGMKLQSGMLLFGPPGCGKTMLAGVVAHECGLNFISVKGPELLSKYIGASEAAVRDLFGRASAAAPCILFFDEFDSIAQKRGHDSTGVTDRVVNQILTHLDGVEPLSGVYVLAATSRPDLIDPALLRPGRLDTHLHCPLPDKEERHSILKALLSKVDIVDEVDVESIAEWCENFTGADLRALVYDAQLKSLHDTEEGILEEEEGFYNQDEKEKIPSQDASSCSDSSFSTAGLELEEHYNSNGMSSILKDLKDEESKSDDSLSPRVTISDVTRTAGELIEAVQNAKHDSGAEGLQSIENRYQICYGLSSSEFSGNGLSSIENEGRGSQRMEHAVATEAPRCVHFSSLYSKQPGGSKVSDEVQNLISAISSASMGRDEAESKNGGQETNRIKVGIRKRHLMSALLTARPSVSAAERARYLEICRSFTGKYAPTEESGATEREIWDRMNRNQQRATLA